MKKNKARFFWFNLLVISLVIFFIGRSIFTLGEKIKNLDYFKVKDVIINGNIEADLSYLKGYNIFAINLAEESRDLKEIYPSFRSVRLIRILPNRLFVDFVKRKPLALVRLYRYFSVDQEAVLFDSSAEFTQGSLPLITGLETKIFGPKLGRQYNNDELRLGLRIIREIPQTRGLRGYRLRKIDVANPANVSFFIANDTTAIVGLEVKIGQNDLSDKIIILSNLLLQMRTKLKNIKYIDLRFKEPAIRYNDAK